jgi:NADPH:quinone reductase-like Zn-dependent oxidoreductase
LLQGAHLRSAAQAGTYYWEVDLSLDAFPYLEDHRVQGLAVLPAAAYLEMALKAAAVIFGSGRHALEDVSFKKALVIPEQGLQRVQLVISRDLPGKASFQFFSLQGVDARHEQSWALNATGLIRAADAESTPLAANHHSPEAIKAGCRQVLSHNEHYDSLTARGIQYGSSFQGVVGLCRRDGEALGQISLTGEVESQRSIHEIHPALLDACFQVLAASLPEHAMVTARSHIYLPMGLDSLRILDWPAETSWSHALLETAEETRAGSFKGNVYLLDAHGKVIVEAVGLALQPLEPENRHAEQSLCDSLYGIEWQPLDIRPRELRSQFKGKGVWVLFSDSSGVGLSVAESLRERGETCITVSIGRVFRRMGAASYEICPTDPEGYSRLIGDVLQQAGVACRGIVHLWSLDTQSEREVTPASLERAQELGCASVLLLVKALSEAWQGASSRLWLVTRGAQPVATEAREVSISQSPLLGFAKAIAHEHPELHCTTVDLDSTAEPDEADMLFRELWSNDCEEAIALRSGVRYAARFVPRLLDPASRAARSGCSESDKGMTAGDRPFRLKTLTPGTLDGLTLEATTRQRPGRGEVEIEVRAVGLNFRDVMLASGLLPSNADAPSGFGWECAGKISAIGDGVDGFQVGDDVFAIAAGCFSSFVVTPACLVLPKPAHLSHEDAATIPIALVTAYLGLHHMSRLREGERVLIHSASGGVGLAALRIAQQSRAEVFATAGSPEKRRLLRDLGVKHVFDSRSLAFADEIMKATGGEGIDVVLNSLAGQAINAGLSILRTGGRFVELGRRDIYQNAQLGLRPFQKCLSFLAVELALLIIEQPA